MLIGRTEVENIAHLARIAINESDVAHYVRELSNILELAMTMADANTEKVSLQVDISQRLREDVVGEVDQRKLLQQRELLQRGAPKVADDLYLVEKVME